MCFFVKWDALAWKAGMFSLSIWHALIYHSTVSGIQIDLGSDREVSISVEHKKSSFMGPGNNIELGSLNLA